MKHNTSELVAQVDEVSNKDPLIKILLHYYRKEERKKEKKRGEHIQKCRQKKMVRTNVILAQCQHTRRDIVVLLCFCGVDRGVAHTRVYI